MRFILLAAPVLLLAGCVLPPAIAIGSYAADGLSYLVTGKSVSDHAISEVVGEDCATWRMVKLENPCHEYDEGEGSKFASRDDDSDGGGDNVGAALDVAALDEDKRYDDRTVEKVPITPVSDVPMNSDATPDSVPASKYAGAPRQVALSGSSTGDSAGEISVEQISDARPRSQATGSEPAKRVGFIASDRLAGRNIGAVSTPIAASASGPDRGVLLVLGSFSSKTNAQRLVRVQAKFDPVVIPARIGGVTYYRVVTRTDPATGLSDVRRRLLAAGIRKAWRIRSCSEAPGKSGCVAWNDSPRGGTVQVAAAR